MDSSTPKSRLYGMTDSLLNESAIPLTMRPIVKNMVRGYFEKITDSDIETIVIELATQVVPYILGIDFETFLNRLRESQDGEQE